jgi:uncharacterized membrane protein YfcA
MSYRLGDKDYSFCVVLVFLLSLAVGLISGIYSIGDGSIITPFLVITFRLLVSTVVGAAMVGSFVTFVAGVTFFRILAETDLGTQYLVAPEWTLGLVLGAEASREATSGPGCSGSFSSFG